MKPSPLRRSSSWLIALLCFGGLAPLAAGSAERGPARVASNASPVATEGRAIVKFKSDSALMHALSASSASAMARPQHARALSQRLGLALIDGRVLGPQTQVLMATGMSSQDLVARLSAQPDVDHAVVDQRRHALAAPNDPLYGPQTETTPAAGQWYLRAPDATTVSAINAESAWDSATGAGVVVAVIDTGVRPEHPDLAGKLLTGYDFISTPSIDNAGADRHADATDPGDWVTTAEVNQVGGSFYHCSTPNSDGTYSGENSSWHGTQTAGLIGAATNNAIGMAGVGPDVTILPLRVLGKCGGYDSDIQDAMKWAGGGTGNLAVDGLGANPNPAKVINLSLGGSAGEACPSEYQTIINDLLANNVVVVASAGNDGLAVGVPANCTGVIAVGGLRHAGTKVGYSDLGPNVALSAPAGNCVNTSGTCLYPLLTTSNTGTTTPLASTYTTGEGDASLGTSFSAPLVSGTVALMFAANSALAPADVLSKLRSTARAFPTSGSDPIQRVDGGPFVPVSACTAPTSTAQNYECYCTTSTCGAGMLDSAAAVASAPVIADISLSSASPTAGTPIALAGSATSSSGDAIASYAWVIASDSAGATLTDASAPSPTLLTTTAGTVTVQLTVTDVAGHSGSTDTTISVAPAPVPVATGSSGGGAISWGWLAMLLAAVIALWAMSRPSRRQ